LDAAVVAAAFALLFAAIHAVAVEVAAAGGLVAEHIPLLLAWLLLSPLAAVVAAARPIALDLAAAELDHRAGLHDRIGTALEFAGDSSVMADLQRADAAEAARGLAAGRLFVVAWRRRVPVLFGTLALLLMVVGASLTWRFGPAPAPPPEPELTVTEDLLAAIDKERDYYEELGDKKAVRLLTDLERTIRRVQAREEELRQLVDRKAAMPEPEELEPELQEPDIALPEPDDDAVTDLITAEDLARLEAETLDQLEMTDAQERELISQLFDHTRTAKRLTDEFEYMQRDEVHAMHNAEGASSYDMSSSTDEGVDQQLGDAMNQALSDVGGQGNDVNPDPTNGVEDMLRRDLSDEAMAEHDAGHDRRESFNQFLEEFVKDMKDVVADAAMGRGADDKKKKKKKGEGREVSVDTGQGVGDKSDAMAESGFEEMGDTKRATGAGAPEEMAGSLEDASFGDGQLQSGPTGADTMAMQAPADQAGTSAGASGAGKGTPSTPEDGLAGLIDKVVTDQAPSGPLEEVLSQLAQGRLPEEEREQLFDRLARHKVQAGLASEADDVVVDYFADAEEMMISNRDSLPVLFRDYAHAYFEAIRPGGDAANP